MKKNIPGILKKIIDFKIKEIEQRKKKIPLQEIKKNIEKSDRDFLKILQKGKKKLIAEIKKKSPTMSQVKKEIDVKKIAKIYEKNNVSAISVLCDNEFFNGSLCDLKKVKKATKKTPILCKEFIIDKYQIFEARKNGADAVLLLANVLNLNEMRKFVEVIHNLSMDAVCEIHTKKELEMVLKANAKIIMINNRNLHNFKINLNTTNRLVDFIPKNKIIISASGVNNADDIEKLSKRVNAVLVGTAIMKASKMEDKIKELLFL